MNGFILIAILFILQANGIIIPTVAWVFGWIFFGLFIFNGLFQGIKASKESLKQKK